MPSCCAHLGLNFWDDHRGFCLPTTPSLPQGYDLCSKFLIFLGLLTILVTSAISLATTVKFSRGPNQGGHPLYSGSGHGSASRSAFTFCCFGTLYIICIATAPHVPFLTPPSFLQLLSKTMGTFFKLPMLYTHVLHVYAIHIAHIYMCPGLTTLDWTNYVGVHLWVKNGFFLYQKLGVWFLQSHWHVNWYRSWPDSSHFERAPCFHR